MATNEVGLGLNSLVLDVHNVVDDCSDQDVVDCTHVVLVLALEDANLPRAAIF